MKSDMRKIYYIGGSPCSGKTTIAQQIAKERNLLYFSVDDELGKYAQMGAEKGYPICLKQWKLSPDETWLRDPAVMCQEELQFYREIFEFIKKDLAELPKDRAVITEAAAFLPELMKNAGISQEEYLCLTPVKEFQIEHYRKREWVPMILEGCSDKEKAFHNWMERDVLFAEEVRRQCEDAGYRSQVTDGHTEIRQMKRLIEAQFFDKKLE